MTSNNPPIADRLELEYEEMAERIAAALAAARDLPGEIKSDSDNDAVGASIKAIAALAREAEAARKKEAEPHLTAQRAVNSFFAAFADRLGQAKQVLERRGKAWLDAKAAEQRRRAAEAARIAREDEERRLREAEALRDAGRKIQSDHALDRAVQAEQRARLAEEAQHARAADLARTKTSDGGTATLSTTWGFEVIDLNKVPLDQLRAFFSRADIEKAIRGFVRAGGRQLAGVDIRQETAARYR